MSEANFDLKDGLPEGTIVGRYEIGPLLGCGGNGVVYRTVPCTS